MALAPCKWLVDFGRVAFGNVEIGGLEGQRGELVLHLGEAFTDGGIDRNPPGSVRYQRVALPLSGKAAWQAAPLAVDAFNTRPVAVPLPPEWGVITPFRWVEIEGWPEGGALRVRRTAAYASSWDDHAAAFECSEPMMNRIWELCRYSIKATTFAGVYVDGDRERISYEADAYINQLGHYACDPHAEMARATFDHLMEAPTWPTEWAAHMVFIVHADWMFTGETRWAAERYEALKAKLLPERERGDGLLTSLTPEIVKLDLVDWPPAERDEYEFTAVNTVVNAFQFRALGLMAELARALGKPDEAAVFAAKAEKIKAAFGKAFFDPARGLYRDGETATHSSLHANMFPLAFGLVPEAVRPGVLAFIKEKGMACSVYPAQYLLEALFEHGEAEYAIDLMHAPGKRSWRHMVESGTTITWEAWDQCFKPNQDWNHAWGAAPANILPRYVLGVQPVEAGYRKVTVRPRLGNLEWAKGMVPTVHGPIRVEARRMATGEVALEVSVPEGVEILK